MFQHEIHQGQQFLRSLETYLECIETSNLYKNLDETREHLKQLKAKSEKEIDLLEEANEILRLRVAQQGLEIGRLLKAHEENEPLVTTKCGGCGRRYVPGSGGMVCDCGEIIK